MDDRRDDEPLPPPPEPPPLPEQPLGPPSMADDPPAGQGEAAPGHPPSGQAPPPQAAPGYPPPPPQTPPPPPTWQPPAQAPPIYQPPGQSAPHYPPPAQPPPQYPPPAPYQPPPPAQKGPHGQPVFRGMETASWGRRVGAYFIDSFISAGLPMIVAVPMVASDDGTLEAIGAVLLLGALFLFFPLYSALFEARGGERQGQTLGKQMLGIRVVRDNGESIGFGFGLLRELAVRWGVIGFIGAFFLFPPLLNYLWPLWDESNRALHDMVVSTHVVRAQDTPGGAVPGTAGLAG